MAEVTGTLLDGGCEQMPFITDLVPIFRAFGGREKEYDWLVTDLVYYASCPEFLVDTPIFITGERLSEIVAEKNPGQFVWAVFTGFSKGTRLDLANLKLEPYADGNPEIWRGKPHIQYPGAAVELICWDSTATVLITSDVILTESFRKFFTGAVDLEEANRKSENAG